VLRHGRTSLCIGFCCCTAAALQHQLLLTAQLSGLHQPQTTHITQGWAPAPPTPCCACCCLLVCCQVTFGRDLVAACAPCVLTRTAEGLVPPKLLMAHDAHHASCGPAQRADRWGTLLPRGLARAADPWGTLPREARQEESIAAQT
jgi:hypothetical protein